MKKLFSCLSAILFLLIFSSAYALHSQGPGLMEVPLITQTLDKIGTVSIWNTPNKLRLHVRPAESMQIENIQIYVGTDAVPSTKKGNMVPGRFNYKDEAAPPGDYPLILDLEEDLGFSWDDVTTYGACVSNGGTDCVDPRLQNMAIHASMIQLDEDGAVTSGGGSCWAYSGAIVSTTNDIDDEEYPDFESVGKGWGFSYSLSHPRKGHFVDSPVGGLSYSTPTSSGLTDGAGGFNYYREEEVQLSIGSHPLGSTVADHKISPLDLFPGSDTDSVAVINMARLLQSLDVDGTPKDGIVITREVVSALDAAMSGLEQDYFDFSNSEQIEDIIDATVANGEGAGLSLLAVSAEDAKAHLEETLNNAMFRKNISKTAEQGSAKAKMNIMPLWFPALQANGESAEIKYYDEENNLIRTATEAKPVIVTYTDADPVTGAHDVWAAVSRDDGTTWKRKNLSRSADLSSFTTADGTPYYGHCKKPVFQVKGNKILVAWNSKFARGGKPGYSIDTDDDYAFDDPYYVDDIWGVGGPQRSHDYTEDGYPEEGEVPYAVLWTCRGIIATDDDISKGVGELEGDIVWFKPERVTSGRRDVNQIFVGAASGAGFAMVWQEDPNGLRPGRAVGPGPGWGGATTSHKTDIWYSYLSWGDHAKVDANFVPGGDSEHDLDHITRPKALVTMSLPIRLTDNDVLNKKNMGLDDTTVAENLAYMEENLTRCVKFEGGKTIVEPGSPEAADYYVLRATPEDHYASMNCTNCHVPYNTDPMGATPTQGSPIPLVVIDAETNDYLGGFTNGDCVSCHYSNIVPRDRLIAVAPGLDENAKCSECESKGGIWKDGSQDGGEIVEAYYPYDGYPYLFDEDSVNDGTHRYGTGTAGLLGGGYYTFINNADADTSVAITTDGRLMDGDTGASRANIFMQPYVNEAGKTSAWAIITYEETKGAGSGPPEDTGEEVTHSDDYIPESGKNVIYHSFDFKTPELVSAGYIMNQPEYETTGSTDDFSLEPLLDSPKYLVDENGAEILDYLGRPQLAYENARRGRFILQGAGAVKSSGTIMLMVYKEGEEGAGRPSDIMMQRWVVPTVDNRTVDNPYRFENIVGDWVQDTESEQYYRARGPVNMSSITPTQTTGSMGDPETEDPWGAVKIVKWKQTAENLADLSSKNRYDDARAHRGQIRGNFVQLGFSYTPNWAAARNGNDKYDFFIRRSFDGGATWTTDPTGQGVNHCYTWTEPSGTEGVAGTKTEVCTDYPAGEFESMRNLSQLPNAKESVIEPRIVAVPGTIKSGGVSTGIPEDKQNPAVFYVAWGTSTNPKKDPLTGEQEEPVPADLFYSFSMDKGKKYHKDEWVVQGNPITPEVSDGDIVSGFPWMGKGPQEQGEVQLRMTPDGSRFYASWLDEGEAGSDIVFRRIMSADFTANNASETADSTAIVVEEEAGSDDDFTSDSGGNDD